MRIAVLLIVFLAGCYNMSPSWTKPGASSKDFRADDAQCEAQAITMANAIHTSTQYFYYTGCMKGKGWTLPDPPKEEEHEPKHDKAKHGAPKAEAAKH